MIYWESFYLVMEPHPQDFPFSSKKNRPVSCWPGNIAGGCGRPVLSVWLLPLPSAVWPRAQGFSCYLRVHLQSAAGLGLGVCIHGAHQGRESHQLSPGWSHHVPRCVTALGAALCDDPVWGSGKRTQHGSPRLSGQPLPSSRFLRSAGSTRLPLQAISDPLCVLFLLFFSVLDYFHFNEVRGESKNENHAFH